MARIRSIKPEFPQSESIGRLSRDARLLFIQLWTFVDDSGRARAASRMLASQLYPYDDDAPSLMEGWLAELEVEGCIRRYDAEGNRYLEVANWLKHQKIDRPTPSRLPESREASSAAREDSRGLDADLGPRTLDRDLGSRTKERAEGALTDAGAPEVFSELDLVSADGQVIVRSAEISEYEKTFPNLKNVRGQIRLVLRLHADKPANYRRKAIETWLGEKDQRAAERTDAAAKKGAQQKISPAKEAVDSRGLRGVMP